MKRCYTGCPNRRKWRFNRCIECKKKEVSRRIRRDYWLAKRDLDASLEHRVGLGSS